MNETLNKYIAATKPSLNQMVKVRDNVIPEIRNFGQVRLNMVYVNPIHILPIEELREDRDDGEAVSYVLNSRSRERAF